MLGLAPCDTWSTSSPTSRRRRAGARSWTGTSPAEILQGFEATVDWPGSFFYRELIELYPDAKVLLSVRSGGPVGPEHARHHLGRHLRGHHDPAPVRCATHGRSSVGRLHHPDVRDVASQRPDRAAPIRRPRRWPSPWSATTRRSRTRSPRSDCSLVARGRLGADVRVPRTARPGRGLPAGQRQRPVRRSHHRRRDRCHSAPPSGGRHRSPEPPRARARARRPRPAVPSSTTSVREVLR